VREDAWLSGVLGRPSFAVDAGDDLPPTPGPAFFYGKTGVDDVDGAARLVQRGFLLVDTNVTLARDVEAPIPAAPKHVVEAAADHYGAILNVAATCFRYSRFHLDPGIEDRTANHVKREWARSYVEGRRGLELLVALDEDRPVGFLAVLDTPDARVIDLVGVDAKAQGRGFGAALVSAFIARHAGAGKELRVGTQIANVPSLRLYAKLGFVITSASYVFHLHVKP
jgi:ribosomal protein S18 acetylase RimI-like enzyme